MKQNVTETQSAILRLADTPHTSEGAPAFSEEVIAHYVNSRVEMTVRESMSMTNSRLTTAQDNLHKANNMLEATMTKMSQQAEPAYTQPDPLGPARKPASSASGSEAGDPADFAPAHIRPVKVEPRHPESGLSRKLDWEETKGMGKTDDRIWNEARKSTVNLYKKPWSGRLEDWVEWKLLWAMYVKMVSRSHEDNPELPQVKLSLFLSLMPNDTRMNLLQLMTTTELSFDDAFAHVNDLNRQSADVLHRDKLRSMRCPDTWEAITVWIPSYLRTAKMTQISQWELRNFLLEHNVTKQQVTMLVNAEQDRTQRTFDAEDFAPWKPQHFVACPSTGKQVFTADGAFEYLRRKYYLQHQKNVILRIHTGKTAETRGVHTENADGDSNRQDRQQKDRTPCGFCDGTNHRTEQCYAMKAARAKRSGSSTNATNGSEKRAKSASSRSRSRGPGDKEWRIPEHWMCWSCGALGKHTSRDCPNKNPSMPFREEAERARDKRRASRRDHSSSAKARAVQAQPEADAPAPAP
jgi:hypothetical protein